MTVELGDEFLWTRSARRPLVAVADYRNRCCETHLGEVVLGQVGLGGGVGGHRVESF